ncbi:MAG: precorrin-8X methylmutase [Paracoccaceae bacterium]
MTLFDGYLMVDWSAAAKPTTGADSIWIAYLSGGDLRIENPATRLEAMEIVADILNQSTGRVLAGFDFPFGYPEGTAKALTGGGWQDLWALLAREITDTPDNGNHRFAAAARLNTIFDKPGPFWGNGTSVDIPDLPRKKPDEHKAHLPARQRYADTHMKGAQEVWKLSGIGSVGGQALTGIAALERLRHEIPVHIWPFEPHDQGHVLCEIYPSMLTKTVPEGIKDAIQVRKLAEVFAEIDRKGRMVDLLDAPQNMPEKVRVEESCMLGQAHETLMQQAAHSYIHDPGAIYKRSFTILRAEADFTRLPADLHATATRLIHACGMVDLPKYLSFSPDVYKAAHNALNIGAPVLCDVEMVRAGIIIRFLHGNEVIVTLNDPRVPQLAKSLGTTRSAAAIELWRDHIEGAVVTIGNAPTALFHLLEKLDQGWPKPAAILGFPVGFVGAAESKAELAANPRGVPYLALNGRRGGSAMASAALNAMAAGLPEDAGK